MLNSLWAEVIDWTWGEWGTILTGLGTLMSAFALWAIQELRRAFIARQRLPELKRRLKDKLAVLQSCLVSANAFEQNRDAFVVAIREVNAIVASYLGKTLNKQTKKDLAALKKRCNAIGPATGHADAFELYGALRGVEESLLNEVKDLNYTH